MQLKEKPELHQINQESEFLAKTYQPDRPIKEPKSVATTDRTNLQPIKKCKSLAKKYQPDLRPIKKRESAIATLLKITFIYFPLGIILSVIVAVNAIPDLASCGNKAKHSEAKQYAGSMNRAQQAYFAENRAFSNSITALGLGIKTQTTNYNYSAIATKTAAFSYGVSRSNNLRSYVGAVFFVGSVSPAAKNEKTTASILCETTSFGKTQPPDPIIENGVAVCAAGSSEVSK